MLGAAILLPLLAALALGLAPARLGPHALPARRAVCALVLLLAVAAPLSGVFWPWAGVDPGRAASVLAVLVALAGGFAAWDAAPGAAASAALLAGLGGLLLAAGAGGIWLGWSGLALARLASAWPGRRRATAREMAGLGLAWLGLALLQQAAGGAADWAALGSAQAMPGLRGLGAALLLVGLGAEAGLLTPRRAGEDAALRDLAVALAGLGLLLRATVALGGVWQGFAALGLLAMAGGAWRLCAGAGGWPALRGAVPLQLGLASLAMAQGGASAGLLLLALLVPAVALSVLGGGGGLGRIGLLALAGLPPLGLFAGDFACLRAVFAASPWLGGAAAALLLAGAMPLVLRPVPASAGARAPALAALALLLLAGLALPAPLAFWLAR